METKTLIQKLFELKQKSIVLLRDEKAFNYQYADLSQIQDKIAPALFELRLLVMHNSQDGFVVTKIIDVDSPKEFVMSSIEIGKINTTREWDSHKRDKEGNILETVHNIEVTEQDPQAVGSIITYYRRYNLLQLLDLKTEDNDGSSASPRAKNASYSNNNTNQATYTPKGKQLAEYISEIKSEHDTNVIKTLQDEAKQGRLSEKQIAWLDKEVEARLTVLKNSPF